MARWRNWKNGVEAAELAARTDVENSGTVSPAVAGRLTGPSPGSTAVDTQLGTRIGIVHNYTRGVAYLREPGSNQVVWPCPYPYISRPTPEQALRAKLLDAGVALYREDPTSKKGATCGADPPTAAG
ncbi:hypothetical protein [Kitasatospora sp. NBC_01300]|uniref:hypothetical protein n=1 Tax=Kitasatospora sp. NBC_01300 TaxID=2903574 RepID=UPI00352BEA03|nr:hypothetical protein OG556_18270 [Kitasatospora sp. NBC_01300]